MIGHEIYSTVVELFPICRSLTGDGIRETLSLIQKRLPDLKIHEVPSGTGCFDWTVPKEWNIRDAYILDPEGKKIVDFKVSNLHVLGYSIPIDAELSLEELQEHLYSRPDLPDAIPYMTSYYQERWGFCLSDRLRKSLKPGRYRVKIDSELKSGSMTYGEWYLKGKREDEIFLSTYICHPSMANNELTGPCVTTFLANFLKEEAREYSYRVVFIPETIGSIYYISRHLDTLKQHVKAGFVVNCVGDDRTFSYVPSRAGDTLADKATLHVLKYIYPSFKRYTYLDRGSDERQYCSPGVDLPMCSILRSKYGAYPEYHTSLDNLDFVTPDGLGGSFEALKRAIEAIELDCYPKTTVLCEPQLGKRGLYPTLSTATSAKAVRNRMNLLAYADGHHSLLDIAELIDVPIWELYPELIKLEENGLLKR
jgi:aminopeptidase-like protein